MSWFANSLRRLGSVGTACLVAACSSPGPTPEEWAKQDLASSTLDSATVARLAEQNDSANLALFAGRPDDAIELALAVLGVDARNARARAIHGRALATKAMLETPPSIDVMERAEGELLLARRLAPSHPEVQLYHAWFLEADGHLTSALAVLDALLEKHPAHLPALRAASRLHFELGEERAAAPLLVALLQAAPGDAASVYRLAHCRLNRAESIVRRDVDVATPLPEDAARLAFLAAGAIFRRHQALVPADIAGLLGEAHARYRAALLLPKVKSDQATTEITEVRQILGKAAELDPSSPRPDHSLGVMLEHLAEHDAARTAYNKALARDPKHLPSILNMARMHDKPGQRSTAVEYCRRALVLDVTDSERKRLEDYVNANTR